MNQSRKELGLLLAFIGMCLFAVLDRDENGNLVRKAGIMGTVHSGGEVRAGDSIVVELPPMPHRSLDRV
jgi:MOSC domain-containing protein YiiM